MKTLIERRDLCRDAANRSLAVLRQPIDVDAEKIRHLAEILREKLTSGDVSARKAWLGAVIDRIVIFDDKIKIIGRKSNFDGPIKDGIPARPPVQSSVPILSLELRSHDTNSPIYSPQSRCRGAQFNPAPAFLAFGDSRSGCARFCARRRGENFREKVKKHAIFDRFPRKISVDLARFQPVFAAAT